MFKYALLSAFALITLSDTLEAQTPPKLVDKEVYEKTLKNYSDFHVNLSKPAFYKLIVWETSEGPSKFTELTDFEKDQFYLVQGFKLTKELHGLALAWKNELVWQGKLEKQVGATPEEIVAFMTKLLALRKAMAVDFEKLIDDTFEKHKDKLSKKEHSYIKKQIINFHDKNKLVERKDDSQKSP
jgi:hypothetical protein